LDLLVESNGKRVYLSQYKVLTTEFEDEAPVIKSDDEQLQYRNGGVHFGAWHESKSISWAGYYQADSPAEETHIREQIYALLSNPDGIYVTELADDGSMYHFSRPGETTGNAFDQTVLYPSHKRFFVQASGLSVDLQGRAGEILLYKVSCTFKTVLLPYGESVPRTEVAVDGAVNYRGTVKSNQLESMFGVRFVAATAGTNLAVNVNGTQWTYTGPVGSGDTFDIFGYEYTKNGASVVSATNKAYFTLLPCVRNSLTASISGTISILNMRDLYA